MTKPSSDDAQPTSMDDVITGEQSPGNEEVVAAIDLGSNSFHLLVGRVIQGEIKVISKLSEKVMLAAGLDENERLDEATVERGLSCLERFAQRLKSSDVVTVRAVATNALRVARNRDDFVAKAEAILDCELEIIPGREEARLIYLGVAHTQADDFGRRLVIDIGGGSTEFSIGERFETAACESLHMGCVSYAQAFFADGKISAAALDEAIGSARREIWSLEKPFKKLGWSNVVGASGTIRAVEQVLLAEGLSKEGITRKALDALKQKILSFDKFSELDLAGLKSDRQHVFVPGFAIFYAIVQQLDLKRITYSDGALREGVLYDQLGRDQHENVRARTTKALAERYHVDSEHAERVSATALDLYDQVVVSWSLVGRQYREVLKRSAHLHEMGLAISHSQFHKHGAYIMRYSDLAGFSRHEQLSMSCIIRSHRRKFLTSEFDELSPKWRDASIRLAVILRLAVLFHHSRSTEDIIDVRLVGDWPSLSLSFPEGWLDEHPLSSSDFKLECVYLAKAKLALEIR